jgi:uncharacterized protein YprB with RNaseH-like and TPR domain/predicted nuclease with RNAse H fold
MIKSTFIFIPGIGEITEKNLWRKGILTWDHLKECSYVSRQNKLQRRIIEDYLRKATKALYERDVSFFAKYLPQKEQWRISKEFWDQTLFLDIETTGLSSYYDQITLIGTYARHKIKIFMRDNNLAEFPYYLQNYQVIVTFNGRLFDIPFIKKEFPQIKIPQVHIDLRYLLKNFGITGSLKAIEEVLGIPRPRGLEEINGRDAAVLWNKFVKGNNKALERLLLYNIYDTVNLANILRFCYQKKAEEIKLEMNRSSHQLRLTKAPADKKVNHYLYRPSPDFDIASIITSCTDKGLLEIHLNNEILLRISRDKIRKIEIKIDSLIRKIKNQGYAPISVGIDLSGSEKRTSGICILQEMKAYLGVAKSDIEIVSKTISAKPAIISIDSPLGLPKGRCCADDSCGCRVYGITRECERILKKRGINIYPSLIKSMQTLTMRGIKLANLFEEQGYKVIESYPGAAQDVLRLPRKRVDLKELETDLMIMGIKPISSKKIINHHEIDALTAALVGYFYLAGEYEAIGNTEEKYLIIPLLRNKEKGKKCKPSSVSVLN